MICDRVSMQGAPRGGGYAARQPPRRREVLGGDHRSFVTEYERRRRSEAAVTTECVYDGLDVFRPRSVDWRYDRLPKSKGGCHFAFRLSVR